MAEPGAVRQKVGGVVRRAAPAVREAERRARRAAFLIRLQVAAELAGARLETDVADDLMVGRDIRIEVEPATRNVLRIAPGSQIEDQVVLRFQGGTLDAGERTLLRRDVILDIGGLLRLEGFNPLSYGTIIHCAQQIVLEPMAGLAEQVTVADSSHYFTTPERHFWHNVKTSPVRIGRNTWVCPKVTVARGADVGAFCIIAAGSVVTGAVPDGSLASGVPATSRPMVLPWDAVPHPSVPTS